MLPQVPEGQFLTLSNRDGEMQALFRCLDCGREQRYQPADRPGGITVEEAIVLGWRLLDDGWRCPFCIES